MSDDIVVNIAFRGNAQEFLAELSRAAGRAKADLESMGQSTAAMSRAETSLARLATGANRAEQGTRRTAKAMNEQEAAAAKAKKAMDEYNNSLSNARYVLYDVAGTLTILGGALVTPLVAATTVAAKFEQEFAQVARTSGVAGAQLQQLKREFDALYGSIPITYEALAKIATLAGQLGVPAARIDEFTETVAKTAAVTDLSVEQAATAFGRLDALIPNVKGQYDRLGSSIAKVGVNSVATESEIVNISTQISSMGAFAGLTAQDIIGLSGALASIGAQPELSRGTVTRVFTLMSRAVASGGEELERFAALSGVSAQQFSTSWGTPAFTDVFLGFMKGIQSEGGNAVAALNDLGITSVRDVPLLLRLANAADSTGRAGALLAQTIGDSNQGWSENIELQRQYEIIASTVASRVQVLVNNLNLLLQAVGGPMLAGLGEFVSFLTQMAQGLTAFASSDVGGAVVRTAAALTALLGVLALAGGAMALMGASTVGLYQAMQFLAAVSPRAASGLLGTAGAAALADGSLKAGATSALVFGRALKAITVVGTLLILPEVISAVGDALDNWAGTTRNASGAAKVLATDADLFADSWTMMIAATGGQRNVFADFTNSLTATGRAFLDLDNKMNDFIKAGDFTGLVDLMNEFREASGKSAEDVIGLFGNIAGKAEESGHALHAINDEITASGVSAGVAAAGMDEAANAQARMEEATNLAAASLGLEEESMKGLLAALKEGSTAFFDFADWAKEAYGEAGGGIDAFIAKLDEQLAAQEEWANNVTVLTARGATSFVTELAKMGPEGAQLAADAVNMSTDELSALEEKFRRAGVLSSDGYVQGMADAQPILTAAYRKAGDQGLAAMQQAILSKNPQAVSAVISDLNSRFGGQPIKIPSSLDGPNNIFAVIRNAQAVAANNPILIQSRVITGPAVRGMAPQMYATGGRAVGPGTGTSDSILARISNDEYIVRANAAKAIGYGRLDYMNRYGKLPAFADGGRVGGTNVNVTTPSSVRAELSATDRSILSRRNETTTNVHLTIGELARQVNNYNDKQARRGR